MKQKVVIKVTSMNGQKSRSKALQIVVGGFGVESVAFKGDDKTQIEVTGDGMDAVALTSLLRKKMGYAEIVSLGPVAAEGKKDKDKAEKGNDPKIQSQEVWPCHGGVPHYVFIPAPPCECDPYYNPCSIM
ncbi:heavy metal-associated isoprenylated plant protein 16-like [Mangifera indica]|uniref:heavy metal-associated isoprenylated plant protein 16-like n=1 Tax=Mangifera indica TaxID=29780 RepID=UPI001CFA46F9|nr:heavy metal-associated isoprenylated plant protein 16-like [Mangifera indica]